MQMRMLLIITWPDTYFKLINSNYSLMQVKENVLANQQAQGAWIIIKARFLQPGLSKFPEILS